MAGIYSISIYNYDGEEKNIALFPAHFARIVLSLAQSPTSPFALSSVEASRAAAAEINKNGFSFDAVLDDGNFTENVYAYPDVPTKKIRQFVDNVRNNTLNLEEITIKSTVLPID